MIINIDQLLTFIHIMKKYWKWLKAILLLFNKMSVPNTFNPSDYEYLLKSLIDGTPIAKS